MLTTRDIIVFWLFAFTGFILSLWLFQDILLPFVLGIGIAYLLDPLVARFNRLGLGRSVSAILILFLFILCVVGFFVALTPVLYEQTVLLVQEIPNIWNNALQYIGPHLDRVRGLVDGVNGGDLQAEIGKYGEKVLGIAGNVFGNILDRGIAVFDFLSLVLITPVTAYYFMKDWPHIKDRIRSWLPVDRRDTILALMGRIDGTLSGFVRGQLMVALILGAFYGVALSVAGLKFGFVVGIIAGLLSIVPFLGSITGLVASVGLALFQFGYQDPTMVIVVAAIFLFGQMVEGNILTPKLVGGSVGLSPIWVIFALMAGGSLMGVSGMLIAVPVAAVIGVLSRFGLECYLQSPYYKGARKGTQKEAVKKTSAKKKR